MVSKQIGHSKFLHMSSACYKMSKTEKELGVMNPQKLAYHMQLCALQRLQHNVEPGPFQGQGPEMNISFCTMERSETDFFEHADIL